METKKNSKTLGKGFLFLKAKAMKKTKNLLNEEVKLKNVNKMTKKHEPIIWDNNKGELTDFYQVAKGLELNHIIYVSDSLGILNSVWATAEEDIVDCFYSFSDNYLFGRIQKIEDVLDDSFFDKLFNLN